MKLPGMAHDLLSQYSTVVFRIKIPMLIKAIRGKESIPL
jgi:hypothetical protein